MDNSWLKQRNCGIHLTIRDIDCQDFDAERMAKDFNEMGVNFFSFFAGGYVTTYPSKLPDSRMSPQLGSRDLVSDIVKAAHKYGIKAAAMVDFSVLSKEALSAHPDWAMVDQNGEPYEYSAEAGVYTACILRDYSRSYGVPMIREIIENYDVDAMKFGGGSYGFDSRICYCPRCTESFFKYSGKKLPTKINWDDPVWHQYLEWKTQNITRIVIELKEAVRAVNPEMPVMGNAFIFGSLDMEKIACHQEMIQLESQGRVTMSEDASGALHPITFTAEAASYMTNVTDVPVWLVVSYFTHSPWRRSAFNRAEQKVYMAQIAAFGGSPMVNLSGGPPAVHEDQRGFAAPAEIWRFVRDNRSYYNGDKSGANVAMVYSDRSVTYYGRENPAENYIAGFRGMERVLWENHIPFDIISQNFLTGDKLRKYKTIILPNYACMREEEAQAVREFVLNGGNVIGNFETSLFNEYGLKRDNLLLSDLFGADYTGVTANVFGKNIKNKQNYCKFTGESPLLAGLEDTSLLPIAGRFCQVKASPDTEIPLRLGAPFMVMPEGLSYQILPDMADPMAVTRIHKSGGKTVYFPGQLDKLYNTTGHEGLSILLSNAVKWTLGEHLHYRLDAPDSVMMSVRLQPGRTMIHLVNLTGGQRFLKENIPVFDLHLTVDKEVCGKLSSVFALSGEIKTDLQDTGNCYRIHIPKLTDYDVIVLENNTNLEKE